MDRPMTNTATTDVILEALKSAAEDHGKFEAEVLHGEYDVEWPQWYAVNMATWLNERGFQLSSHEG